LRRILLLLLTITFLLPTIGKSQQTPQWTQYVLNQYAINPAYAGLDRSLSVTAALRSQWTQLDGAPSTQMLSGHVPLYFLSGAAGMMLVNDNLGPFKRTGISGSYNYVLDAPIGLISAGFRIGVQQVTIDGRQLITPGGVYQDNVIDHRDPRLLADLQTGYSPTWSMGLFYAKDLLEVGIAIDNLGNTSEAGASTFNEKTVFSLYGAYQLGITEILAIEPNILLKTDGSSSQLDIGILAHYDQFLGGFSFRGYNANTVDALGVVAGVRVSKNVRVSYSFDLGLSDLRPYHDGTHEFLINYNLNKPIRTGELPRIIYNPRYN